MNGTAFLAYVEQVLAPTLKPGDIVVRTTCLPTNPSRSATLSKAQARLFFLPPYSPDFNPIEMAFSKIKALLKEAAARTVEGLWAAIASAIDAVTPSEARNYYTAAGYEPE